jgi:hypothetical protein
MQLLTNRTNNQNPTRKFSALSPLFVDSFMKNTSLALIIPVFFTVLVSTRTSYAEPTTIEVGDVLVASFRLDVNTYTGTPELLRFGFNTEYSGDSTASLYDGDKLLGTYTWSSGGSQSAYFKDSSSIWPRGVVVDMSSIVNGSIEGRIEYSPLSGPVTYDPDEPISGRPYGRPSIGLSKDCQSPEPGGVNCTPAAPRVFPDLEILEDRIFTDGFED